MLSYFLGFCPALCVSFILRLEVSHVGYRCDIHTQKHRGRRKTLPILSNKPIFLEVPNDFPSHLFGQNWVICPFPGLPCGSDGKASAYNMGDLGSIPGSGRSSGEGNGNPLQYSCLENPMNRGAW